jgi:hypothetical protein
MFHISIGHYYLRHMMPRHAMPCQRYFDAAAITILMAAFAMPCQFIVSPMPPLLPALMPLSDIHPRHYLIRAFVFDTP